MNLKRTKVSYVLWFLLALATCVIGYSTVREFGLGRGMNENDIWILCAGVLLFGGLFSVLAIFVRKKVKANLHVNRIWLILAECIIALGILAAGVLLRIRELPAGTPEDFYFSNAGGWLGLSEVKYQQPVKNVGGYEGIYVHLLHGLFFLLGNTTYFSIRFQIVLTILAGILIYFGVRELSGKIPALTFFSFYCFTPCFTSKTNDVLAEPLVLIAYGIAMILLGAFLKRGGKGRAFALLIGALAGAMGYYDVFGFTLVIFAPFAKTTLVDRSGDPENAGLINAAFLVIGCAAGFLAAIICRALSIKGSIPDMLSAYGTFHFGSVGDRLVKGFTEFLRHWHNGFSGTKAAILLIVLLIFCVAGFWANKNIEKISPWICCMLITGFGLLCGAALRYEPSIFGKVIGAERGTLQVSFDGSTWFLICLFVLAGIGIESIFGPKTEIATEDDIKNGEEIKGSIEEQSIESAKDQTEKQFFLVQFVTKIIEEHARKKEEAKRDAEKVLRTLSSLSEDRIVWTDGIKPNPQGQTKNAEPEKTENPKSEQAEPEKTENPKSEQAEPEKTENPKSEQAKPERKEDGPLDAETESMSTPKEVAEAQISEENLKRDAAKPQKPVKMIEGAPLTEYDYEVADDDDYDLND